MIVTFACSRPGRKSSGQASVAAPVPMQPEPRSAYVETTSTPAGRVTVRATEVAPPALLLETFR